MKGLIYLMLALWFSTSANGQVLQTRTQHQKEIPPPHVTQGHRWWNLQHYDIAVTPDYHRKYITGINSITFSALKTSQVMQIDLQEPMQITGVTWKKKKLVVKQTDKHTYIISFPVAIKAGATERIVIEFSGYPREAFNPPYDSGWIWAKDEKGRPWISVACEGLGASLWLPCKEVLYDEPENGISFSITVPDTLVAVSNGRLHRKSNSTIGFTTYTWKVLNPINNYNIIPYVGKYVTWREQYPGLKGKLDCDFYMLDYNLDKAKIHLKQTDTMLNAFEYWLGPYPFYEDSYKLVEAPMPGMEHQSAVAYGNGFQNGHLGKDFISGTGWGMKWDFMLVHESGHEWFGNSITCSGSGDSWIHEGFTKYLETLYTCYVFGTEAGNDYAIGTWRRIKNDEPILGTNTSDKYYKGSAMLHMVRQYIGDTLFRGFLIGLNRQFYHQAINTNQILRYLNEYTGKDFTKTFEQYLTTTQIPRLSYSFQNNTVQYRWENCVDGFSMPVKISVDGKKFQLIFPTKQWQSLKIATTDPKVFRVDRNFYITSNEIKEGITN